MSLIAMANTFLRARESARPVGDRILEDPWATGLVRNRWRLNILWSLRLVVPGLLGIIDEIQAAHCVRHAAVDVLVRRALTAGHTQVVVLGAGLDARSQRLGREYPLVRWFEVDRSADDGHKQQVTVNNTVYTLRVYPTFYNGVTGSTTQPG